VKLHRIALAAFTSLAALSASAHWGFLSTEEWKRVEKTVSDARISEGLSLPLEQFRSLHGDEFFGNNRLTVVRINHDSLVYFYSQGEVAEFFAEYQGLIDYWGYTKYSYDIVDLGKLDLRQFPKEAMLKLAVNGYHHQLHLLVSSRDPEGKALAHYIETVDKKLSAYAGEGAGVGLGLPFILSWFAGWEAVGLLNLKGDHIPMALGFLGGMTTEAIGFAPSLALCPLTALCGAIGNLGVGIRNKVTEGKKQSELKTVVRGAFDQFFIAMTALRKELGDDDAAALTVMKEMLLSKNSHLVEQFKTVPDFKGYFEQFTSHERRENSDLLLEDLSIAARILYFHGIHGPQAWNKIAAYFEIPLRTTGDMINFMTALYFMTDNKVLSDVFKFVINRDKQKKN
jgi:hypothetical protein